jgi:hypothetical protein
MKWWPWPRKVATTEMSWNEFVETRILPIPRPARTVLIINDEEVPNGADPRSNPAK